MVFRIPQYIRYASPGFLKDLIFQVRLVYNLMRDRRVRMLLKLIPLASIAYLVIPDFIPFPIDDILVLGFGMNSFIKLCPADVVQEHRDRLKGVTTVP